MRRLAFFAASLPVAICIGLVLTDELHTLRFWLVELPLAVVAFAAWCWLYVETCSR